MHNQITNLGMCLFSLNEHFVESTLDGFLFHVSSPESPNIRVHGCKGVVHISMVAFQCGKITTKKREKRWRGTVEQ